MPIPVKSSGPISFSEISAGVSSAGGTASTSFANLSRQAYAITGESRFLIPDKFTDFEYVTTTTTTTAAPVYYYNATRCFDGANKIVYGGNTYYGTGTVVISGGTTYCYTIQNEVIPQAYDDTVSGLPLANCNAAECYVLPTTTTTTLPPLSMTISQGCVNYAGTGTINITGVTGGSGNYVYHIGGLINFSDPTQYSLNQNASGLANGNYYVAVYDSSQLRYVDEIRTINCPAVPTTTTTTLPPVYYYNATRCFDGANKIVYGGNTPYGTGTVVISGITTYCYTIQNEVGAQAYEDTVGASVDNCNAAECYVLPTTTTTTLPPFSITVSQGCVNYAGTGTISITGVSGGSGNYVYHIGGPIDYNDPNAYNLNSSASGLSNGSYYAAVYDSSQLRYAVENININCPAAPTTTTTTAAPTTTTTTTAVPCRTYEITAYDDGVEVSGIYINCGGGNDSFSFTGLQGVVGSICAQISTVQIASGGGATDVGSCS